MKALLNLFFIILLPLSVLAEKTTIVADADIMEKNSKAQTLMLKGKVNVIFKQQHLLCDEAIVYEKTSMIIAKGNVVLQNAKSTLRGEKIEFNYDTNTGKLYGGVVTAGQVLIQSDVIEKIGEDEYVADNAYYTACLTCPPSWGFTSSQITANVGGYAYINRPWLHLLEVPILPLPYLVVPLNSKRQTGLLVPSLGTGTLGGLTFEQPFYWAIDRSHDATFTLLTYAKRGAQLLGNYRYVISPTSSGELNSSFLVQDRTVGRKDRWFIQYGHTYDLPENYTQRTELALASDNQFQVDFPKQLDYVGEAAFNNNISLTKAYEDSLLTIDSSYYISLLETDFENTDSVHRMPEINYEVMDQKLSDDYNLFFNLDLQYLNIASQGSAFRHTRFGSSECSVKPGQDPNDVGVCYYKESPTGELVYGVPEGGVSSNDQYGDIIRTGQRLDLMPSIHAPFWVGDILDVDPSFSMRYTQYSLGVESAPDQGYDSFPSRFYTQFDTSIKSYVSRVFDWGETRKLKHSIIPELNIKYIPEIHQSNHNFFGSGESLRYFREQQPIDDSDAHWRAGGRGIQFDNRDRVIGKQLAELAISNKVVSRNKNMDDSESAIKSPYQQNFLLRVSQVYDINDARRGSAARPWQDIRTLLQVNTGPFSQSLLTRYFPYHGRTLWTANSRYSFLDGNTVSLSYLKFYTINLNPPVDDATRGEFLTLGTSLKFNYVNFYGSVTYDLKAARSREKFRRWRALVDIFPPGSCWTARAGVERQLSNANQFVTNFIFNMEFTFGQ